MAAIDPRFDTQHLTIEIDTGDATLGGHTARRLYYIYTDTAGVASPAAYEAGLVADLSVMYATIGPLLPGVYRVWAESMDTTGRQCVSEAFLIPSRPRGTVIQS